MYRSCVSAEIEPKLNSSSCYPLVHFSRPFCQNHGVTLPSYVYATPSSQIESNYRRNADYNTYLRMGPTKASYYFKTDVSTIKKCVKSLIILFCHEFFPSCDRTQSVFKKRKICRESCLEFTHSCGRAWKLFQTLTKIRYPGDTEKNKRTHCKLQPYRNAGDSPECWYFNRRSNITGNINIETIKFCSNLWNVGQVKVPISTSNVSF